MSHRFNSAIRSANHSRVVLASLPIPLAMLSILAVTIFAIPASAEPVRPNVVMLLADDLGYRDVGCYGGPVQTPTIDSLAAGGTRFEQFYSGCAVCSPSRATLLTGRHHIRTGVYSWIHDESQNSHLRLRETTLAEVLQDAGYATAHIGKWHLGLPTKQRKKPTPDQHGFDYWFATWNNAEPSHRNPNNFIRNGTPVGKLQGYSCQLVADEAIGWMKRHHDSKASQPFFLNVWFHEPHAPIAAPDNIVQKYGKTQDKGAVYSGTIDNTDSAIARLLKQLDELNVADNTLIIYASDNGSYRSDRVGNLRGRKGVNWDGGIRVPGIFHWPGHIPADVVLNEPAGLVDVLPTVCGLLGLKRPNVHLDGSDLSPLLTRTETEFNRHQPLFWHLQRSRPIVAMRDGDYSLVGFRDYELSNNNLFQEKWIPTIKSGGYKNFELYNLREDPGQTNNLAEQHPDRVAKMRQQLLEINASIMNDAMDWHVHGPEVP
ncbi:sulfatase-like hydrolase/transferase [Rhodopirellula sp. JC740]|uniref:Sulfatase-like hydrolase/transferase n=1 Tax=Rhodopirellula halodulae TaxID=2894198 RepID=A0ABS8NCI0_9BACT|nr:sulfatase-like hydrolase/transferase [Rhodopirellula sp. JC740]MCC9641266.1 sulfatase-like hydrolase/transferase [Rhodopirellula sp. JC740]